MVRILAINGSYREGGITDQTLAVMIDSLRQNGAEVETIVLSNQPIKFCLNCRECTQAPGNAPGVCIFQDDMKKIVHKIEQADGYILASPTNMSSVTAIFKRFMERLIVYAYWPWGTKAPQFRKVAVKQKKKALLVSSCAAPGLMGRLLFSSLRQLKFTAKMIGAHPVGAVFTGLMPKTQHRSLTERQKLKAGMQALKLLD